LTVLDGQLDRDAEALPVTSGFGDIFTDLYVALAISSIETCGARETYSLARDQGDRSWGRGRMKHRLHHQSHEGG
jgi:hypothetical protein